MDIQRTVHAKVPKATDVEIHVSTLTTDQGTFTDIREFIVSLEQYGRGITFPLNLAGDVLEGVHQSWAAVTTGG